METSARHDATPAHQEEQLHWHALILQNVRESIIVTDVTGAITYWNAGASALFGYTAAEMLGRTPAMLYPAQDQTSLGADLSAIAAGRDYRGTWRGRRKDGTALWLDITTTRLRDAAGTPLGFIGVARDITALHEVTQARDDFLAGVVHDLKTPLTSIRGHAQLATRRLARLALPASASLTEHLAQIEAGTQRLARLLDELADLTRLQMGATLEVDRQPTDVVALARAVVGQQAGLTEHRLTIESTPPTLEVVLDAPRIERVLANLLANAVKYSSAQSTIILRVTGTDDARGAGVTIAVQDRGVGIPAADLPHVFERFHRARNVVGVVPGSGIGLASARAIVQQHGGTICVESVEGRGTTVTVWLPRRPPVAAPADGEGAHLPEESP